MKMKTCLSVLCLSLALTPAAQADEGQWQPHQLLELKSELKRIGIQIPAEKLADLTKAPMNAIVSLGGCSASFVSPKGLIVTNHHCAYGAIQRNSTAEKNYIADGFVAKTMADELPAGPNQRVYVTDQVTDVTAEVLKGIDATLRGKARHDQIERNIKALIAQCESSPDYRCAVPSFHRGLEFYLIRQLMLRDIRLVYAPSEAIGAYGGDIDNFEFPRHTGDFAFYRAYIGKDGKPADPSPDNVPYASKDYLTVSAEGLKAGDPILLAGYPGRTSRYKLPEEIRFARDTDYPMRVTDYQRDLQAIADASTDNSEWSVRYAATVKSINNRMKKLQGLLDGFGRKDVVAIKQRQHQEFLDWIDKQGDAERYRAMLSQLDELVAKDQTLTQQEFVLSLATSSDMLSAASTAYRLAKEKEKPDAERDSGYQQRDIPFIKARLQRMEQSLVPEVDRRRWQSALNRYQQLNPQQQLMAVNKIMLLPRKDLNKWLTELYQHTQVQDTTFRLSLLEEPAAAFTASNDHLVRLAVMLYDIQDTLREQREHLDGDFDYLIPQYMQAVIAWKKSQGKPVYPDANSTLRVTYGTVAPYSPADGLTKGPFTTVEGIAEKHTGKGPFDAPDAQLRAIAAKQFGVYRDPILKTVPVNFLSSADTTGGNSGSAVINKRGELIGLNFDSTYESITKDWYFDPEITRAIHVDIRYMLWVMQELDGAEHLIKEMTVKYPKK
ncbi:S46 family peptidase [Permianibacter aggregans]|uniref:Dipeptidyl-peptidase n=1 Tax=Permianibacter aggregans TaxID=1510150 RepID=A0A4R6UVM9_9GAMM|nr:S46 family peptidase [Permianibacter aggregans]QGX41509.1 S46 family peptidase [Permianibacter aggregans]TDQ51302.1 dipeptidyl-peptidase 7 [Permianibacter aggregans]